MDVSYILAFKKERREHEENKFVCATPCDGPERREHEENKFVRATPCDGPDMDFATIRSMCHADNDGSRKVVTVSHVQSVG